MSNFKCVGIVASSLLCASLALADPIWLGDDDFDREIAYQYWTQWHDLFEQNGSHPITQDIQVVLTGNYLLTRSHNFSGLDYPTDADQLTFNTAERKAFFQGGPAHLPGSHMILSVPSDSTTAGAWNQSYPPLIPVDDTSGNSTPAPGGENGRIVAGFKALKTDPINPDNSWKRLDAQTDQDSIDFLGRLPANAFSGATCKVWFIELGAVNGPVLGDNNPQKNSPGGHDNYYKPSYSNETLRFDGAWPRKGSYDGYDTPSSFNVAIPLVASLGDTQLRFASEEFSTEPSGAYRWGFAENLGNSNETVVQWNVPSTASPQAVAAFSPSSPRLKSVYSLDNDATIPQSDIRCTVFHRDDYSSVETGVSSVSDITSGNQRQISFTLDASPWNLAGAGDPVRSLGSHQRFRVWNAAEFLDTEGEMVIDTQHRRLYFIPWTGAQSGSTISSVRQMDGRDSGTLFVGLVTTNPGSNALDGPPFVFANCDHIKLQNFVFRTTSSEGMRIGNCDNFMIQDCLFQAVGQNAISLAGCTNTRINHCGFDQSLGRYINIRGNSRTISDPLSEYGQLSLPGLDFLNQFDRTVTVDACAFQANGQLYPADAIDFGGAWTSGVTIGKDPLATAYPFAGTWLAAPKWLGNSFTHISNRAVGYGGIKTLIGLNTFEKCCLDATDSSAVYTGRSWIEIGNRIDSNTFINCNAYFSNTTGVSGDGPKSDLSVDVAPVMLDDMQSGQVVQSNIFKNCVHGIVSNGGRYNWFFDNVYTDNLNNIVTASQKFRALTFKTDYGKYSSTEGQAAAAEKMIEQQWNQVRAFAIALKAASGLTNYVPAHDPRIVGLWSPMETKWSYRYSYPSGSGPAEVRRLVTSAFTSSGSLRDPLPFGRDDVLTSLKTNGYLFDGYEGNSFNPSPTVVTNQIPNPRTWFVNKDNLVGNPYQVADAAHAHLSAYYPDSWYSQIGSGGIIQLNVNINFWYGYIASPLWAEEEGQLIDGP